MRGPWRLRAPRPRAVHAAHLGGTRPVARPLVLIAATAALAACGPGGEDIGDVAVLADRAERLADHLDAGEGCPAEREGQDLVARARDAVAAERLAPEVADEIVAVVTDVTDAVPCDDEGSPEEAPEGEAEEPPDEAEEPPEEAEEPPEESEAPEEAEEAPTEDDRGPGNGESGPPGRSEEGPPGQRGHPGRGNR